MFGFKRPRFEFDDHVTTQFQVIKQQVHKKSSPPTSRCTCRPTKAKPAPNSIRKWVMCCTIAFSISRSSASFATPKKSNKYGSFKDSCAKSECGLGNCAVKLETACPSRSNRRRSICTSTHCATNHVQSRVGHTPSAALCFLAWSITPDYVPRAIVQQPVGQLTHPATPRLSLFGTGTGEFDVSDKFKDYKQLP